MKKALTDTEKEVLRIYRQVGFHRDKAAAASCYSPHNIKYVLACVTRKLEARNSPEAYVIAVENNLL